MSNKAVGWVYDYSPYEGAPFAIHLAIADSANDQNHMEFWMSLGKLGQKCRVSRQSVSGIVARMVDDGFLELVEQSKGGRHKPSRYRLLLPAGIPLVFDYTTRSGVPLSTVVSPDSTAQETVGSGSETVGSAGQTVGSADTRRTQEEPKGTTTGSIWCQTCGNDFPDVDAYQDHIDVGPCPGNDWMPTKDPLEEGIHDASRWFREHGEAS